MKFIFVFLILILINNNLYAQAFIKFDPNLFGIADCSLELGDYDNDGDLDILISGKRWDESLNSYVTKLYRNNSDSTFTDINLELLDNISGAVVFIDYDNDNDLDFLLTGNQDHAYQIKLYENIGNDKFDSIGFNLEGVVNGDIDIGDFDNDSDFDILISGFHSYHANCTRIYKNDGGLKFTTFPSNLIQLYEGSVEWGDYDSDGDMDFAINGADFDSYTSIYRNDGNGQFVDIAAGIAGISYGEIALGDYDADGDLDIALTGMTEPYNYCTKIYRNDGNDTFVEINHNLIGLYAGSVQWGDYDNDGDLDLLLTGANGYSEFTRIYRNEGNDRIINSGIPLQGVHSGKAVWGDLNNDGALDIVLSGVSSGNYQFLIYYNNSILKNTKPSTPTNVSANILDNKVFFSWDASYDDSTPSKGLTYNKYLKNISIDSILCNPNSNLINGKRLIVKRGNINGNSIDYLNINDIPDGTYEIYIQAIDAGFVSSDFSSKGQFTLYSYANITIDTLNFNDVGIGEEKELSFYIHNYGNKDLIIHEISIPDTNFTLRYFFYSIAKGDSNQISIQYKPNISGQKITYLNIKHSGNDSPLKIPIKGNGKIYPKKFNLKQNYPNPYNFSTKISYNIPYDCHVKLILFDICGRKIKNLVDKFQKRDFYSINYNANQLASGIYFYKLVVDHELIDVKKMILIR